MGGDCAGQPRRLGVTTASGLVQGQRLAARLPHRIDHATGDQPEGGAQRYAGVQLSDEADQEDLAADEDQRRTTLR
jgi:hypothetical protein